MRLVLATHRTNQWLGVNKYFYLLGKYLAKMGIQVRFVGDSPKGVENIKEICDSSENIEIVKLSPTATNPVSTLVYCDVLSSYLVNHKDFDILHCGHILPYLYLLSGKLLKEKRKPVVFQPFGNELFTLAGRGINKWYCKLAQPILRYCGEHADVLLSEGEFQNEEMAIYYPKAKRLAELPVGVEEMDRHCPKDYKTGECFQFLAVSSLLPYEGVTDLVRAFGKLNGGSNVLVIVGKGSEENRIQAMSSGLRIAHYREVSEDMLWVQYRVADAFVCPTYETDFQMGVLEAMASGLPVIARDANWLPESVIRFQNTNDLAEKMSWLSSQSASKRTEIAKKGLKEVRQYGYANIAKEALKIYSEVLGD